VIKAEFYLWEEPIPKLEREVGWGIRIGSNYVGLKCLYSAFRCVGPMLSRGTVLQAYVL
jgi:hypothetical protein